MTIPTTLPATVWPSASVGMDLRSPSALQLAFLRSRARKDSLAAAAATSTGRWPVPSSAATSRGTPASPIDGTFSGAWRARRASARALMVKGWSEGRTPVEARRGSPPPASSPSPEAAARAEAGAEAGAEARAGTGADEVPGHRRTPVDGGGANASAPSDRAQTAKAAGRRDGIGAMSAGRVGPIGIQCRTITRQAPRTRQEARSQESGVRSTLLYAYYDALWYESTKN